MQKGVGEALVDADAPGGIAEIPSRQQWDGAAVQSSSVTEPALVHVGALCLLGRSAFLAAVPWRDGEPRRVHGRCEPLDLDGESKVGSAAVGHELRGDAVCELRG